VRAEPGPGANRAAGSHGVTRNPPNRRNIFVGMPLFLDDFKVQSAKA
jgi:hypothetical protein